MRRLFGILIASLACAQTETGPRLFIPDVIGQGTGEVFRGTFSPLGDEFYFFRKVTPGEEGYRVFRTRYTSGAWGPAERLSLGDDEASTMYPVVSPDGRLLVVTSYRRVGDEPGNADLWAFTRSGSEWGEPTLLDAVSTRENYDASPWFGPEGDLRFTSTSPDWRTTSYRRSRLTNTVFNAWEEDTLWPTLAQGLAGHHLWSGVVDPTGTMTVAEVSVRHADGSLGPSDLWVAERVGDEWEPLRPLGDNINTAGNDNFPSFSPDGSVLVFVRDFEAFYRVESSQLRER